jgi:threonine/homoserine/homoserine lactone efflux protein
MSPLILLKAFGAGVVVAGPMGPVAVLVTRRTIAVGMIAGFIAGLGAAFADAVCAMAAVFGVSVVANFVNLHQFWFSLAGGLILCAFGIRSFFLAPPLREEEPTKAGYAGSAVSTFVLTMTNPATFLGLTGIFAATGLGDVASDSLTAVAVVVAVFLGSVLWWVVLSAAARLLFSRLPQERLVWLNRIAGILLFAFGLVALAHGFWARFA